jgi:hypothetical protein
MQKNRLPKVKVSKPLYLFWMETKVQDNKRTEGGQFLLFLEKKPDALHPNGAHPLSERSINQLNSVLIACRSNMNG